MNNDLVVKQANKLIYSVYRMEANEQKLILLATRIVNEMEMKNIQFNSDTEIVITADQFAKAYGINKQRAFEFLCEAKNTIYDRSFEIDYVDQNGQIKPTSSRWIHRKGEMKAKSEISMFFAPAVIPFIYLVKEEFTLMDLKEVGRLKSKYAIRLYKYLMRWKNANFQPTVSYEQLREILGLDDEEYLIKYDFKKRVLDVAVNQINKGTGFINLKYEGVKKGTSINHFKFTYEKYDNDTINITPLDKSKAAKKAKTDNDGTGVASKSKKSNTGETRAARADKNTKPKASDSNHKLFDFGMTVPQANMFASKIIKGILENNPKIQPVGHMANENEDPESFKKRICEDLLVGNFKGYEEALKALGCKEHNFLIWIGERVR